MKKHEFIARVAFHAGMTQKDAEKAANAVFETIAESLERGEKLNLIGFGAFETRTRTARTCRTSLSSCWSFVMRSRICRRSV